MFVGPSTDVHISKVGALLCRAKNSVMLLDTNDVFKSTFRLAGKDSLQEVAGIDVSDIDVVWLFRPAFQQQDFAQIDPEYCPALAADTAIFEQWMFETLAPSAVWINPYGPHIKGSNKALQAQVAGACGLLVPPTLLSNRPDSIRDFIANGKTLLKPISRHLGEAHKRRSMSTPIHLADLPPDEQLALQPCYLQRMVEKIAEWRVHVMGDEVIAIRLWPSVMPSHIDWNLDRLNFCMEERVIDNSLMRAVKKLVQSLGLVFACIDFLENKNGELHFLEVNQMGRFLWFDRTLPQARISERFVSFLMRSAQQR